MKRLFCAVAACCCFSGISTTLAVDLDKGWPQWRGPDSTGSAATGSPPVSWSETENVRWKVEVPGIGSSTPIVWGDRVYVSTAVKTDRTKPGATSTEQPTDESARPERRPGGGDRGADAGDRGDRDGRGGRGFGGRGGRGFGGRGFGGGEAPVNFYDFMVLAYDRASGKELWRTTAASVVPHEPGHNTNTFASSSPITDGKRLFVSFGSRGIYCLDLEGKVLWDRDLGQMETRAQFGEGSSPALYQDTLVVPWDHEGESFIVGLDANNGEEKWRVDRDERTTWATPLITPFQGRVQVVVNGSNRVRSYDLQDGTLIWECGGQASNPIPTPVRFEDNVICMTGYRGYAIYSIPLSSQGDITDSDQITWYEEDAAPYVPSPLLYQGALYFAKGNNGVLMSRDAKTGDVLLDQTRLPEISSIYASPVAANGHLYITGRDGTTLVIQPGSTLQVVATNRLDDSIDASAAIVDNEIFLRSKSHLYCIAEGSAAATP